MNIPYPFPTTTSPVKLDGNTLSLAGFSGTDPVNIDVDVLMTGAHETQYRSSNNRVYSSGTGLLDLNALTRVWCRQDLRLPDSTNFELGTTGQFYMYTSGANTYWVGGTLLTIFTGVAFLGGNTGTTLGSNVSTTTIQGSGISMSASGGIRWKVDGTALYPSTDLSYDLGKAANKVRRVYMSDYASIMTTADSNASAAEFDVFDEDNYSTYTHNATCTADGVTYTSTDGRFTVDTTGVYEICCVFNVQHSGGSGNVDFTAKVNGSTDQTLTSYVHASVDPVHRVLHYLVDLTATDYVTFHVDGANTVVAKEGTHAFVRRFS